MASCTSGVITVKTDYTITPEYQKAVRIDLLKKSYERNKNIAIRHLDTSCIRSIQMLCDARDLKPSGKAALADEWLNAYDEARRSHAAGEPLIRTVCKIATRILLVLLIVGIAVGVMTA